MVAADLHDVERRVRRHHGRDPLGEVRRDVEGQVGIPPPLELGQIPAGKQLGQARPHRAHAVGEEVHRGLDVQRRAAVVQQPPDRALGELAPLEQQRDLGREVDLALKLLDLMPERRHVEHLAGDQPGPGEVGHRGAGLLDQPEQEGGARGVDHLVDHRGADDLPAQRMRFHPVGEPVPQRSREVGVEHPAQVRIIGHGRGEHVLTRRDLGVREQQGEFRVGQPAARRPPFRDLPVPGQLVLLRVEHLVPDQLADIPRVHVQQGGGLRPGRRERHVLPVVVPQHQRRHVVGHVLEQLVPGRSGERPAADRVGEQDLDVDLVVGGVHAGRVVDEVGVHQAAAERVLDPARLGQAQVAALADDARAQPGRVDPHRVVRPVAHLGVGLVAWPSRRCRSRRSTAGRPGRPGWRRSARPVIARAPRRRCRGPPAPAATPGSIWRPGARPRRPPRSSPDRSPPTRTAAARTSGSARRSSRPGRAPGR